MIYLLFDHLPNYKSSSGVVVVVVVVVVVCFFFPLSFFRPLTPIR